MAEPEPQFGDIYKGTPEGLEQVLFDLRNTVYTDPLRRPSYAPREQAIQTPIAYNPFYGIPKKTSTWDGNLLEAASLVNDFSSRLLEGALQSIGFKTVKFDTNEVIITADDYFKDSKRTDYIRKQVGGEQIYNNWLEGRYNHIKDYNSLMNRISYDLTKANAAQALAEASGFARNASVIGAGIADPVALALSLIPVTAPTRVASVAGNVARVGAGAFVGSAVYEGARNLTNEVYNTQDFDANDTLNNLVMGTVAGTLVGSGLNYKSIARASRINRLATSGLEFETRGVVGTPFARAGVIPRDRFAEVAENLGFTVDEKQAFADAYKVVRQQAVDSLRSRGVTITATDAERLIIDEVESIVQKRYDDLKDTAVTVATKYDETTNTFDIEESFVDATGKKQIIRKTTMASLDDPQMQKLVKDSIRLNLLEGNRIGTFVEPVTDEVVERSFRKRYGDLDPKNTFFILNDAQYNLITNKTNSIPTFFNISGRPPRTLDELSQLTKTPKRITVRQSLADSADPNVNKIINDESVGVSTEAFEKTLTKLSRNPTFNVIKWVDIFLSEIWDGVGERIGFIDKQKLNRLKQVMRREERGDIDIEELMNIMQKENLTPVRTRALAWRLAGVALGGGAVALGYNRQKVWNWITGNDNSKTIPIENEIFNLTANYMTSKEKDDLQALSRGALGDIATHNKLLFAAELLEKSTPNFQYARELEAIRQARKAMTNPFSDFTSLNLRLNAILNTSLQEQAKQNKNATRRTINALGLSNAFDEAVDQLVDISIEMNPHLEDFASKLDNNLTQPTVKAIEASLNNSLRQTIGSYDRQVNAFFAEVVARMGNNGNEFLYASTRIRKSLGMIENGLLNGINNQGEAYSANTIIQALGAGMISKLENPNATGDDIRKVLMDRADLTDIEDYFLTIGYNLLEQQGNQ